MAHLQLQEEGRLEVDSLLSVVAVAEGMLEVNRLEVDRVAGMELYLGLDSLLSTVAVVEVPRHRLADRELYLDLDGPLSIVAVADGRLETVDRGLPAPPVVAIVGREV